jgi:hypothetical protein
MELEDEARLPVKRRTDLSRWSISTQLLEEVIHRKLSRAEPKKTEVADWNP